MHRKKNVLLTTSREPTDKIRTFCNDLAHSIPNVIRVNRGKLSLDGVAEKAFKVQADRIVIVNRCNVGFGIIRFFQIGTSGLTPFPPVVNIASVRLRREFEAKTKSTKSIAITVPLSENFQIAKKMTQSLSEFFEIPVVGQDLVSNFSAAIRISSSALNELQITFVLVPTLIEIGPCIKISKIVWDV